MLGTRRDYPFSVRGACPGLVWSAVLGLMLLVLSGTGCGASDATEDRGAGQDLQQPRGQSVTIDKKIHDPADVLGFLDVKIAAAGHLTDQEETLAYRVVTRRPWSARDLRCSAWIRLEFPTADRSIRVKYRAGQLEATIVTSGGDSMAAAEVWRTNRRTLYVAAPQASLSDEPAELDWHVTAASPAEPICTAGAPQAAGPVVAVDRVPDKGEIAAA